MLMLFGPNGINHNNIFPAPKKSKSEGLSGCLDYFKRLKMAIGGVACFFLESGAHIVKIFENICNLILQGRYNSDM